MAWVHRWAALNRHIGDRADTGYLRFNRRALRLYSARVALLVAGSAISALIGLESQFLGALCFLWLLVLVPLFARRELAGIKGERAALAALKKLPRGNILFNSVCVPSEASATGYLELDFVVVTQKGFIVVEVKHQRGRVSGDVADRQWRVEKPGARGTHAHEVDNPVSQVRRQIHALSRHTNEAGLRGKISGVVVYTHPEAELCVSGESDVKVVGLPDLLRVLPLRDLTGAGGRVEELLRIGDRGRSLAQAAPAPSLPVTPTAPPAE